MHVAPLVAVQCKGKGDVVENLEKVGAVLRMFFVFVSDLRFDRALHRVCDTQILRQLQLCHLGYYAKLFLLDVPPQSRARYRVPIFYAPMKLTIFSASPCSSLGLSTVAPP